MMNSYRSATNNNLFALLTEVCDTSHPWLQHPELYKIVWSRDPALTLTVADQFLTLQEHDILFLSPDQDIMIHSIGAAFSIVCFHEEFYKIKANPAAAGAGLLFYGPTSTPVFALDMTEQALFKALFLLLHNAVNAADSWQDESLKQLLHNFLIIATRMVQTKPPYSTLTAKQLHLVCTFNMLVATHFKEQHKVTDYAHMLGKSPKTLTHFFKKHELPAPLTIINNRLLAAAKQLLKQTTQTAEAIAKTLGYHEATHFSKFFKNQVGVPPLGYRKSHKIKQ